MMTTKNQVLTENLNIGDLIAQEDGFYTDRMSVVAKADTPIGTFLKVADGTAQVIDLATEDGTNLALCAGAATETVKAGEEVVCVHGRVALVANQLPDAKKLVDAIKAAADAQAAKAAMTAFDKAVANMKRFGIKLVLEANTHAPLYPADTANGGTEFDPATLIK